MYSFSFMQLLDLRDIRCNLAQKNEALSSILIRCYADELFVRI